MRFTRNVIEQTLVAYAFNKRQEVSRVEAAIDRVGAHYARLLAGEVRCDRQGDGLHGLILWRREDPRLRWPLWRESGRLATGSTGVPCGWPRVVGALPPDDAAVPLARALLARPENARELTPPFVIGVRDSARDELILVNDSIGAGRLYRFETSNGVVWSNRLGALPLFAGVEPEPDPVGWRVLAAAGWFLGETTAIRGAVKVPAGTVVTVRSRPDGGITVEGRQTDARRRLVEPRRARIGRVAPTAADQARELAHDLGQAWDVPLAISLTGGRDSRVSAAAALAAGVDARYNTGDQVPGELDTVRSLIAAAPTSMSHEVFHPEGDEDDPGDDLHRRIAAIHLVHDGMRNPQEVRRPTEIPQRDVLAPTLSGHGGELGHGFYYADKAKLRRLQRGGEGALVERLERAATGRHSAAHQDAYAEHLASCRRTLDEGRSYGLKGPVLLDWFYLAERLPYRSGLGARSGRSSACVTPAFLRGAFDLAPRQRLRAELHRQVIARLVPAWRKIEFFSHRSEAMPDIHRQRIWERPSEASVVEEMIAAEEGWPDLFDPERVKRMWQEVRGGRGSADYEHVFYRLVWRAGFERHLASLSDRVAVP